MKNFDINVKISFNDILDSLMYSGNNRKEIIDFILELDLTIGEDDFTVDLLEKLCESFIEPKDKKGRELFKKLINHLKTDVIYA